MNDNLTNERLAQAAQVKRVFDLLDEIDVHNEHDQHIYLALNSVRNELTDLLHSLGVEVVL